MATASVAFARLESRIAAGESLSVQTIEAEIAADPATAAAFAELATASRAGRAVDYAQIETATGFPRGLINACILSFASGKPVTGVQLVHGGQVH